MSDLGSISFYIDKKTRNNSNPINIPRRKPSIWIPNNYINKCFSCNCEFGLFTENIIVEYVEEYFAIVVLNGNVNRIV